VLISLSCSKSPEKDPGLRALAEELARSIGTDDEDRFVRAHVSDGDMSPSGNYWLATKAGGVRPDAAWNSEVRAAFSQLSDDLTRLGIDRGALRYTGKYSAEIDRVDNDADRTNLSRLVLHFTEGERSWDLTFAEGMLARRGWVITGDPIVTIAERRP
jgi:hypothetical protein